MNSDYEIAKEKDIRELFDLQLRAFESEAEMIGSRNVPALMESFEENCADFKNWAVLIKRDESGRIIGAVRYREDGDHVEIGRVMVAPEHRNRGEAIGLMTAVEELTQAKIFELYTCTKSYININLYEKLGYRTYKEERGDRDLSFAYMRKTIGQIDNFKFVLMNEMSKVIRKHIVCYGWVQGVGFRYRARYAANLYGLTGWVRNDPDGSVTMEIQGTEDQIDQVIIAIERGSYVIIEHMDVKTIPVIEHDRDFRTVG